MLMMMMMMRNNHSLFKDRAGANPGMVVDLSRLRYPYLAPLTSLFREPKD